MDAAGSAWVSTLAGSAAGAFSGSGLANGFLYSLTGEITSCERLIVEGNVEANFTNCREVELTETGLLKGTAAIEDADIRGRFEGTLTVRKRLLIRSTGKVSGTIRYGQLEIELGGQISGDVQAQPSAEDGEVRPTRSIMAMSGDLKN